MNKNRSLQANIQALKDQITEMQTEDEAQTKDDNDQNQEPEKRTVHENRVKEYYEKYRRFIVYGFSVVCCAGAIILSAALRDDFMRCMTLLFTVLDGVSVACDGIAYQLAREMGADKTMMSSVLSTLVFTAILAAIVWAGKVSIKQIKQMQPSIAALNSVLLLFTGVFHDINENINILGVVFIFDVIVLLFQKATHWKKNKF